MIGIDYYGPTSLVWWNLVVNAANLGKISSQEGDNWWNLSKKSLKWWKLPWKMQKVYYFATTIDYSIGIDI